MRKLKPDSPFPWGFVDWLIFAFGLNECEACDLSDRAQTLVDTGSSKKIMIDSLWARADVLVNSGSSMQPMWDRMQRLKRGG